MTNLPTELLVRRPRGKSSTKQSPRFEMPVPPGIIGPYRIEDVLGCGGMGQVFQARPTSPMEGVEVVALKTSQDCDLGAAMLVREGMILQGLEHPGVVQVHHVGTDKGVSYIAMEYLEGQTLSARLRQDGAQPLPFCLDLGIQLCDTLDYLHGTGSNAATEPIIHGDIKPGNLILDRHGRVTLIDFGIARSSVLDNECIKGIGTPAYMAPEQWGRLAITGQADLFMLGVVLFEVATGVRLLPSQGCRTMSTSTAPNEVWSPINALPETIDNGLLPLMDILSRCVSDVDSRFRTAGCLGNALRQIQHDLSATGRASS